MPENAESALRFSSCTSKVEAVEAVFLAISAPAALVSPRGWIAAVGLLLGATWLAYRAHQDRGRSYVEVRGGQIIVDSGSGCRKQVDLSVLADVQRGWNKTILRSKDGTKLAIDHTWFVTGSEAQRFRAYVEAVNVSKQA